MEKKRLLTFGDILQHRPVLYGFAALWIALYHMNTPTLDHLGPISWFRDLGACGVEMFVLLAAPGLFRSMEQDARPWAFWKKRLERVYLPAFIVTACTFGFRPGGTANYLALLTVFPYWLGIGMYWYVPFILTVYLIYPLVYRIQKRRPRALWGVLILSLAASVGIHVLPESWVNVCGKAVYRFPIFLLGCILTPSFDREDSIPLWTLPALLAAFAGLQLLDIPLPYFGEMLAYIPLSMFMVLAVTLIAKSFTKFAVGRGLYRILAICGGVSLEIYLLFDRVCDFLFLLPDVQNGRITMLRVELMGMVFTLILALALNRFCKYFVDLWKKTRIP